MNKMPAFLVGIVLLLSFVLAGVLEFQRDRRSLRSLARMLPFALAVVVSVLLLIDIFDPYLSLALGLSRTMSALALLVAVSALVSRYKSRLSRVLIFIGGLVLAFFWLLNRWVA